MNACAVSGERGRVDGRMEMQLIKSKAKPKRAPLQAAGLDSPRSTLFLRLQARAGSGWWWWCCCRCTCRERRAARFHVQDVQTRCNLRMRWRHELPDTQLTCQLHTPLRSLLGCFPGHWLGRLPSTRVFDASLQWCGSSTYSSKQHSSLHCGLRNVLLWLGIPVYLSFVPSHSSQCCIRICE